MEILRIAVVSSDKTYNRVFSMSLLHACRQLEVRTFTSQQFVKNWAEYHGKGAYYDTFDLILWAGDEIRDSFGDNIIYLTDRASLIVRDYTGNRFSLYKYSPANVIVAAVFDIYAHLTGRSELLIESDHTRIIGFASCGGGSGCTTVSRAVGQELSRFYGRRVLYISMEELDSTGEYINRDEGARGAAEFLYRLIGRQEHERLPDPGSMPFLDAYLIKDPFGIQSFPPSAGRNPLMSLEPGDMQVFLSTLSNSGRFDVILIDYATCLSDTAVTAMELSERICFITKAGFPSPRENSYLKHIRNCAGDDTYAKIIKVENMADSYCSVNMEEDEYSIPAKARVRKMSIDQSDRRACALEGTFGRDISKLTELLLNMVQ